MKKVISLILVLVICLSFAACGGEAADPAVKAWLDSNKADLIDTLEASFAQSSGMTCNSSAKAVGTGIVISIKIDQLDDLSKEMKDQMQTTYDGIRQQMETAMIPALQTEVPELTYLTIEVCEKDGDVIASLVLGDK